MSSAPRILIAEDEAVLRMDLRSRIEEFGYGVAAEAETATEAVKRTKESLPDLVLMDVRLKGRPDGVAAAASIRNELGVPVVFLTAFADEPTLKRATSAEAYGFLVKPVQDRELKAAIDTALAKRRGERVKAESEALARHAQRQESLSVLAGGLARELNTILTPILGFASLAKEALPANVTAVPMLEQIDRAARRAADLTRQLVKYSGMGPMKPAPLDLAALVHEMEPLLSASVGGQTVLELDTADVVPAIEADSGQMRMVVMALVQNAADALGMKPGRIRVHTSAASATDDDLRSPYRSEALSPGRYVLMEVTDSGKGMTADELARACEPYFNPSQPGHGMGLSVVLGIVKQHGGTMTIHSKPGGGTEVRVWLPASPKSAAVDLVEDPPPIPGEGTVLVADGDDATRTLIRRVLEGGGYQVVLAADGREALEKYDAAEEEFVGALLELSLPRSSGIEVLSHLYKRKPDLPVVLMSGINLEEVSDTFSGYAVAGLLRKPFTAAQLLGHLGRAILK